MSHIHIPDGVLPVSWWFSAYIVTGIILYIAVKRIEKGDLARKLALLGVISTLMLVTMSIPLGIIPFHINLTVLTGILAGPALGFVAVFIVNLILSFLGHGGITVIGLNTLILGFEVFSGFLLFQRFKKWFTTGTAVVGATAIALIISTIFALSIIGFSQIGWNYVLPHVHHEEDHHHDHHEYVTDQVESSDDEVMVEKDENNLIDILNLSGLASLILIILIGIVLEVLVTTLIIKFFAKVRSDLIR